MKSIRSSTMFMTGSTIGCLLGTTALVTLSLLGGAGLVLPVRAEPGSSTPTAVAHRAGESSQIRPGENTEKGGAAEDPGTMGFSISVDGERVAGDQRPVDDTRRTDIALNKVDIQVKFDGLDVKPILNVATKDLRHSYQSGDDITFNATTNYPAWIKRAELRIHDAETGLNARPLEVLPVNGIGETVHWKMPATGPAKYLYVLRVYDAQGRYDETVPLALRRTDRDFKTHATEPRHEPVSAGRGEDRTAVRNIQVYGGAVTVFGRDVPDGFAVRAIGETIPVDNNGAFVVQRILPPGEHTIAIDVKGKRDGSVNFERDVIIPENEWFYVGLADLTVGRRFGSRDLVEAAPGEYDSVYSKGRLAFYLKGKIQGRYLLTASADTGEDKVQNLFRDYNGKGPQELLNRIDPDRYYPVYGDSSTAIEDAPTDGKFYVRLERGNSHVMWGRYKTTIHGGEFARNQRKLYGGHSRYSSEATTAYGEARYEAEAYAARPGTLPQRDVMLGTGGSVYFLSRQDLNRGSETLSIEVRDPASDFVITRHQLRYGEDYEINYVQGVVILKKPLGSVAPREDIISDGTHGGNAQYLVVNYEYSPALEKVRGYSTGGRAQAWVTDHVRLGLAGLSEETGGDKQKVIAGDVHVRLSKNSFVEAEKAESDGPGFRSSRSINGGLTINDTGTTGTINRQAAAERVKAQIDLSDFGLAKKGAIGAYYEHREAGFSSFGYDTDKEQRTYGALADLALRDDLRLKLKYKDYWTSAGQTDRQGGGEIEYDWRPQWTVGFGVKHRDVVLPGTVVYGPGLIDGARTDTGVKVTYKPDKDHAYYVFGQGTVSRSGNISRNDRVGVGTEFRVTEKVGLGGEVSYGSLGWGRSCFGQL
ncbi:MAG: hypothetical protein R3D67_15155 [Hyphomicrobiaceae bacterium]